MATPAWSVLPEEWKNMLKERGLRPFRADQILQSLYRDYITDWEQATTLPKDFRETLKAEFPIIPAEEVACDTSSDGTKKLLLKMEGGELVETVVIPVFGRDPDGGKATIRLTQCVSSQIGCAMGCTFCASGAKGIVRSLRADEIVAEVMAARKYGTLTNLVVMGMGEPFANYDETMRALKLINAGKGPNLGARHITLSTCGVVPGFARLADEGLQFELSVSLHAPNDALRNELMPVNRKWPLAELLAAVLECLFGNYFGPIIILSGLIQGIGFASLFMVIALMDGTTLDIVNKALKLTPTKRAARTRQVISPLPQVCHP